MKIVFAVGIVTLIGLLGYLAYVQNTSQNKKIKTLNSSVVELQGQVKELQKQVNNNVSFGTQQSLDALIHQIESEIDGQTESGATDSATPTQQSGGMLMDEVTNEQTLNMENMETMEGLESEELYQELESELTNAFETDEVAEVDLVADVELVEEVTEATEATQEPISLIDDELDDTEDDDDEDEDEEDDDEDDDEEDDEEDEDGSEIGTDNVKELQNEVEDDFMEKLNDFYLSKTQAELRSLCRKHKKPFSGNKQTLVTRILEVDKLRNVTLE